MSSPLVDAIRGEAREDSHVTYVLSGAYGLGWTETYAAQFAQAFAAISAVCGLTFERVDDESSADLIEYRVTAGQFSAAFPDSPYGPYQWWWPGYHYGPESKPSLGYYDTERFTPYVLIHELGHSIGLEHPQDSKNGSALWPGVPVGDKYSTGDYGLNTVSSSMMSYVGGTTTNPMTPMAVDIAALQAMYGANLATASGADTYSLGETTWRCIWDAGGTDRIAYGGTLDATIDLRDATLINALGGGGYISALAGRSGGLTIAHGVVIENAAGGSGDDKITGNSTANTLTGGLGDDMIIGGLGHDVIWGGGGRDTIYLGTDTCRDVVAARDLDVIRQFDSGEDKIDIAAIDAHSMSLTLVTDHWHVDIDRGAAADVGFDVYGSKPLVSDFLW